VQFQTTPFLIYAFVSLQTVALYGNYTLITDKVRILFDNFLGSTAAGIGNLIAEGNKEKILKVYWEMMSLRFLVVGVAAITLYYILPPFIKLWLGEEYILSETVLLLVLIIFSLGIIRGTTDQFLNGSGLFYDIWAPATEAIIFIVVALIGGSLWQLEGVLLGNITSLLIIIYVWKPYFLFKKGFKISVCKYWLGFLKLTLISSISFIIYRFAYNHFISYIEINGWGNFIQFTVYTGLIIFAIQYILLYIGTSGMKNLTHRIFNNK
jgi:O-antigen/teichoic acid export membrane protein